eukprot:s7148_g1.t1
MEEAKQAIEDAQSKLSEALEQGNSVSVAHPSLGDIAAFEGIGKSLGIEFSEEQLSVLRKASTVQMPPGLEVSRPAFEFGPKQPGPADPPEGTGPKEPPPQDKAGGPDASHKYRQLARKKMDLQASITQAKEHLKALVEETQSVDKQMEEAKQAIEDAQSKLITQAKEHLKALVEETQSVDKQMEEAKQAIEDAQSKLSEALEQGNSVSVAHPSLGDIAAFEGIGKSLGIEFSEEQLSVLR